MNQKLSYVIWSNLHKDLYLCDYEDEYRRSFLDFNVEDVGVVDIDELNECYDSLDLNVNDRMYEIDRDKLEKFAYDIIEKRFASLEKDLNHEAASNIVSITELCENKKWKYDCKEYGNNLNVCLIGHGKNKGFYLNTDNDVCCIEQLETKNYYTTNFSIYRMFKPNLTISQKNTFKHMILNGIITQDVIDQYTVSLGKYIDELYKIK